MSGRAGGVLAITRGVCSEFVASWGGMHAKEYEFPRQKRLRTRGQIRGDFSEASMASVMWQRWPSRADRSRTRRIA